MKIRSGFVSNSSSSSFIIIGFKDELTKESVLEALKVDKNSPLHDFAEQLAKFIVKKKDSSYNSVLKTIEDYQEEYGYETVEDIEAEKRELFENGFTIINTYVSYSNSDCPIESYLANSNFEVKTENLYLKSEGH